MADRELIVLVDAQGRPIGSAEKLSTHHAATPLHLAFSCYVLNAAGQLLVTQRAIDKKVWPGVWTNSVCGHPAPEEPIEAAIHRRLKYELGMTADHFRVAIPNYVYQTPPFKGIIEHEYCPVYLARTTDEPQPNPVEVAAYQWLPWSAFIEQTSQDKADGWSWWSKDQLKLLQDNSLLQGYTSPL